jgi:hypothetical protein
MQLGTHSKSYFWRVISDAFSYVVWFALLYFELIAVSQVGSGLWRAAHVMAPNCNIILILHD